MVMPKRDLRCWKVVFVFACCLTVVCGGAHVVWRFFGPQDSNPQYERPVFKHPEAVEAFNRGVAYYKKGEHDKAMADLTEAIDLDPKLAEVYHNWGFAYYNKGEYNKAIADCIKAAVYYNRGLAYYKKGEYDKAVADLTEAINLDPKLAEAYYNRMLAYRERGVAYGKKGEYDKGVAEYDKAIADCIKAKELGAFPEMTGTSDG